MKQDLRIAVSKRMIKDALLRLLEHTPLDKIKVSALCQESGVNRATFYRHYQALPEVLREIETEFIQRMPRPDRPPRSLLEAQQYMEVICTYFYENAQMTRLLFLNKTDEDMLQGMHAFCRSYLELRKAEGLTPKADEQTIKAIRILVGGGVHCLLRQWILGEIQMTPGQIAQVLCNVIRWPDPGSFSPK